MARLLSACVVGAVVGAAAASRLDDVFASVTTSSPAGVRARARAPPPNVFTTILLDKYVETTGARCLDGSPQRLWYAPATSEASARKWSLHMMGGGWCESVDACAARAYAAKCYSGSSNTSCFAHEQGNAPPGERYADAMNLTDIPSILGARWGGGLLSNDPVHK